MSSVYRVSFSEKLAVDVLAETPSEGVQEALDFVNNVVKEARDKQSQEDSEEKTKFKDYKTSNVLSIVKVCDPVNSEKWVRKD